MAKKNSPIISPINLTNVVNYCYTFVTEKDIILLNNNNLIEIVKYGKTLYKMWIVLDRHEVAGSIPARPTTDEQPVTKKVTG